MITRRRMMAGMTVATAAIPAMSHVSRAQSAAPANSAMRQAPGFYRYKIGDIELTAVNDGFADRPLEGYVKNAALTDVQAHMTTIDQPAGKVRVPYTSLVLRTGGKTVMIDSGNGDSGAPTTGTWMQNFRAAGFEPEKVDAVILTHFHGDHINGLRLKSGTTVFPNAEVMVPAAEWDFWMDDARMAAAPEAARGAFANVRRVLGPMSANVKRFAADSSPVPGVTAVAAYGHTPGHTVMAITSGNARMMMMADLTNHTGVFLRNPDWHVLFDMNPEAAAQTRRRMADLVIKEKMQVAFYHAPFPSTGFIEKAGNGYRLEPVQWS